MELVYPLKWIALFNTLKLQEIPRNIPNDIKDILSIVYVGLSYNNTILTKFLKGCEEEAAAIGKLSFVKELSSINFNPWGYVRAAGGGQLHVMKWYDSQYCYNDNMITNAWFLAAINNKITSLIYLNEKGSLKISMWFLWDLIHLKDNLIDIEIYDIILKRIDINDTGNSSLNYTWNKICEEIAIANDVNIVKSLLKNELIVINDLNWVNLCIWAICDDEAEELCKFLGQMTPENSYNNPLWQQDRDSLETLLLFGSGKTRKYRSKRVN